MMRRFASTALFSASLALFALAGGAWAFPDAGGGVAAPPPCEFDAMGGCPIAGACPNGESCKTFVTRPDPQHVIAHCECWPNGVPLPQDPGVID